MRLSAAPAPSKPSRLSDEELAVSIIAVAEVYEGAFGTPDPHYTLAGRRDFLSDFAILPLTDPIVEHFARMRAAPRQQGQVIPDMDLLIAATAVVEDLTLVTRNERHFAPARIESPVTELTPPLPRLIASHVANSIYWT